MSIFSDVNDALVLLDKGGYYNGLYSSEFNDIFRKIGIRNGKTAIGNFLSVFILLKKQK